MNTQQKSLAASSRQSVLAAGAAKSILKGGLAALVSLSACGLAHANDAAALLIKDKEVEKVWITSANAKLIEYKTNVRAVDKTRSSMSSFVAIYFVEPDEFRTAMALYNSRDYKAAKAAFIVAKDAYKGITEVPGNYATLAGYYEMECCRKLMDYEGLDVLREKFISDSLTRPHHKVQLELYATFWDGVRAKGWGRIIALLDTVEGKKFTIDQRAQIAYCAGLAYEGNGQPYKALNKFNEAMISDFGASEVLAKDALKSALRVIRSHPDAQLAMKLHGSKDENPNSAGSSLLAEGVALIELWEKGLGLGEALSKEDKEFAKYKVKE